MQEYRRLCEIIERAQLHGQLSKPIRPALFINWAKQFHIHCPSDLERYIVGYGHQLVDWKKRHEQLKTRTDAVLSERDAKIDELRKTLAQLSRVARADEKSMQPKERNSMLKMIIGMAVRGYGYDPSAKRSSRPVEIAGDLAELGLALSDDTIRKYLEEGKGLLPPEAAVDASGCKQD